MFSLPRAPQRPDDASQYLSLPIGLSRRGDLSIRISINETCIVIAGLASRPGTPVATPLYEHKRFHGASVEAFEAVPLHG